MYFYGMLVYFEQDIYNCRVANKIKIIDMHKYFFLGHTPAFTNTGRGSIEFGTINADVFVVFNSGLEVRL